MQKMKAAVMDGIRNIRYEERDIPEPNDGELLIRVMHTGVCGSDIHYYEHGRINDMVVRGPMVLGHESAGEVVAVGKGVSEFKKGDLVTLEPGKTCGKCFWCKTGRYNLCPDVEFFATPPFDGTFAEYVAHPASLCFRLPDGVSTREGALVEPLCVGFHAVRQAGNVCGQNVFVSGAGCIGLMVLLALKSHGASKVLIADNIQKRLDKALELGADTAINFETQNTYEEVLRATDGLGADVVIDASGSPAAIGQMASLAARGGTLVFVGMPVESMVSFDVAGTINKELSIKSVFRYRNLYPLCVGALKNGLSLDSVVSKEFGFDSIPEALEYNINHRSEVSKIVISY